MPAKIIIDCERLKHPHTGLYHFCYNLGKNLLANSDPETEEINFYLSNTNYPGSTGCHQRRIRTQGSRANSAYY